MILFSFGDVQKRVKEYFFFMLMLETGMIGAFVALDLFLFYVFWELMLVPMYFIIGIWGGPRRIYASIKFLLYTLTASLLDAARHPLLWSGRTCAPARRPRSTSAQLYDVALTRPSRAGSSRPSRSRSR